MEGHSDQWFGPWTYSQHGEDLMIANLFRLIGIDRPSYLDIGAHHPVNCSNTALLYKRGSRGINVEANALLFRDFIEQRPGDVNLNFAIGLHNGTGTMYVHDDRSGRNTLSHMEACNHRDAERPGELIREEPVHVMLLDTLVSRYCGAAFPHLLSIDIEGLDLDVLAKTDLRAFKSAPIIVCVEVRRESTDRAVLLMGDQKYTPHCRMGENLIFIDDRFIRNCF